MYCKTIKNKKYWYLLLAVGAVSLAFGVIGIVRDAQTAQDSSMLLGMFIGMGTALAGVSIIRLLYMRFAPAGKLKAEEINLKDERNIQVLRAAYSVANTAATILFAVMAFVFILLGYRIPGYISAGALWMQVVVFLISYRVINQKM